MAGLRFGSQGPEVMARQVQLIRLGFLAGEADGVFDVATFQAVRNLQRCLLLQPDGLIGCRTATAMDSATASSDPSPLSQYRRLLLQGRELASRGEASDDRLPLLDQGLAASPLRLDPAGFASSLAAAARPSTFASPARPAGSARSYPPLGAIPPIHTDPQAPGGLSFLSDAVTQACLCIAEPAPDGAPLRVRWFGRRPLDCVQFWSATKWIAPLQLVCQAARVSPGTPIAATQVRSADGKAMAPFAELFEQMVSYAGDAAHPGRSNAIGYLFKQLRNAAEPDVQTWLRQFTGHSAPRFLGRYGCDPLFADAELVGPGGELLVAHGERPRSRNLVSAYDLVRMLTLLGWHLRLDQDQRLPWARWSGLSTLVEGLGHDTARYIDHALMDLILSSQIAEPVILSKMGFGAETGDPSIDALTYAAFASVLDRRQDPPIRRSFALALRIPTRPGAGIEADARMGSEVIELVRRLCSGALG
ncbi:MAG: peptidoglycan-binding domain-containing protein [Synechococcus sp. ELA057]